MKIINIDVKDKIEFKNIEDSKTGQIKFIKSTVGIPRDNQNNILLNFNFINPVTQADLHFFAIFSAKHLDNPIAVELRKLTVDDVSHETACFMPAETLTNIGIVSLGIYGYKLNDDETLDKRISLEPIIYNVIKGSYNDKAVEGIIPTPTAFEIYFDEVEKANAKMLANLEDYQEQLENSLNQKLLFYKKYDSVYTTSKANETNIPINISQYKSVDVVFVTIEGLTLNPTEYSIDTTNKKIVLKNAVDKDTVIHITVLKTAVVNASDYSLLKGDKGDKGDKGADGLDGTVAEKPVSFRNEVIDGASILKECGNFKPKALNAIKGRKIEQEVREGYNLLNTNLKYKVGDTLTISGITLTFLENGKIKLNGTSEKDDVDFYIYGNWASTVVQQTFPIGNYTVKISGADIKTSIIYMGYNTTPKLQLGYQTGTTGIANLTEVFNCSYFIFRVKTSGTTYNNDIYEIQITKTEDKDKPYEAYGKTPTPDFPSEVKTVTGNVEVSISNENILDLTNGRTGTASGITLTKNADNSYNCVGTATEPALNVWFVGSYDVWNNYTDFKSLNKSSILYKLKAGITYTIKDCALFYVMEDGRKSNISTNPGESKTTVDSIDRYILAIRAPQVVKGQAYNTILYPHILIGNNTQADYIQHKSQVFPLTLGDIELCKIGDYADYIYRNGSKWFKRSYVGKKIFTSSDITRYERNGNGIYQYRTEKNNLSDLKVNPDPFPLLGVAYCNRFKKLETANEMTEVGFTLSGNKEMVFNAEQKTLAEFKTWIDSNQTILYYQLATPTDTEITDTTLIAQLNALENAMLYEGITNISITGDNLTPIIDLDVWTWYKGESGKDGQDLTEDLYVIADSIYVGENNSILLPEGYTYQNSIIVSVMHRSVSNVYRFNNSPLTTVYIEKTTVNNVERCNCVIEPEADGEYFKVVIKKI